MGIVFCFIERVLLLFLGAYMVAGSGLLAGFIEYEPTMTNRKLHFRPSEIDCTKEEFELASSLLTFDIDNKELPTEQNINMAAHVQNISVRVKSILKIIRIARIISKELSVELSREKLEDTLLKAMQKESDDLGYIGAAEIIKSQLKGTPPKEFLELVYQNIPEEFLFESIYNGLGSIPSRILNILNKLNISTIGELLSFDPEVLRQKGFGPKSKKFLQKLLWDDFNIEFPLHSYERERIKQRIGKDIIPEKHEEELPVVGLAELIASNVED